MVGRCDLTFVLLWSMFIFIGCESDVVSGSKVYPVQGTVRFEGKPASGVLVVFHPLNDVSGNSRSYAKTQLDGTYLLSTHRAGDGAPVGEYKVTFFWPPTEAEESPGLKDKLASRYANPKESQLRVEVKAEQNIVPTFELK